MNPSKGTACPDQSASGWQADPGYVDPTHRDPTRIEGALPVGVPVNEWCDGWWNHTDIMLTLSRSSLRRVRARTRAGPGRPGRYAHTGRILACQAAFSEPAPRSGGVRYSS